jgi:hypothetical protein
LATITLAFIALGLTAAESPTFANTIGMLPVAAFAAAVAGVVIATITSGCRSMSSVVVYIAGTGGRNGGGGKCAELLQLLN